MGRGHMAEMVASHQVYQVYLARVSFLHFDLRSQWLRNGERCTAAAGDSWGIVAPPIVEAGMFIQLWSLTTLATRGRRGYNSWKPH